MDHTLTRPVFVTGGAGFLGRSLVQQLLLQTPADIKVLALPHEPVPADWPARVSVIRGDITRLADVQAAASGCSHVFHLAALVGDGGTYAQHERVTVGGTANVFRVAQDIGAAVILTTSICTYGDAIQRGVCAEDTPAGVPQGPYGKAKQGQEALAWRFRDAGGAVCVVRPANIIGAGSGPWLQDAAEALRKRLPALVGGGHGNAGLAVVDNVADFLVLAARSPGAYGQAFNVNDGLPVSWREYFSELARLLGAPAPRSVPRGLAYLAATLSEPLFRTWAPGQRPPITREALNLIAWDNRFPIAKARSLGWAPRVSYEATLQAMQRNITARGL